MSVDFRRIVETCFAQEALEVWLIAGRPPLLRFKENLRELKVVDSLSAGDIIRLVFNATAPNLQAWYKKHGFCAFDYPVRMASQCSHQNLCHQAWQIGNGHADAIAGRCAGVAVSR